MPAWSAGFMRRVGAFELLARLARGGAARLYLARELEGAHFGRLACVKMLRPEVEASPTRVAMFVNEARIGLRLQHPSCVPVYELGMAGEHYFLAMEYVFGESLSTLLKESARRNVRFAEEHVAALIAGACDGLHMAHELTDEKNRPLEIVHRDVSPQNIMLSFSGQPKLIDFGIAKVAREPTLRPRGCVGKPAYASPEQLLEAEVDRRSDIYSLGVILFEAIARVPFQPGRGIEEVKRTVIGRKEPRLRQYRPEVSSRLDLICAKATAVDRDRRYSTAAEMADALRAYLKNVRYAESPVTLAVVARGLARGSVDEREAMLSTALSKERLGERFYSALGLRAVDENGTSAELLSGSISMSTLSSPTLVSN